MSEADMGIVMTVSVVEDDRESSIESDSNSGLPVSKDTDDSEPISVPTPICQQFRSFT